MSDNHNFDDDDDFFEDDYVPTISRWKLLGSALAVLIVTGFGIGIWYAYDQGVKKGVQLAPPIIKADDTPVKEQPQDPGGMEIPHQDKEVFNVLKPEDETTEKVEQLMAPPETVVEEAAPVDIAEDPVLKKSNAPEKLMENATEEVAKTTQEMMASAKEAAKAAIADVGSTSATATDKSAAETNATALAAEQAAKEEKANEAKATEEAAQEAAKVEAAEKAKETPEVAAPKVAPAGAAYRVQLGAFRSEDAAKKAWRDLQKKHEELLSGEVYKIQSVEIKGKGLFYRLQAGAFGARDDAASLCTKLKAEKQDCLVAKN